MSAKAELPVLRGAHVVLRPIVSDDLETLRQWRNQPRFRQYFREYRDITPAMQQNWYKEVVLPATRAHMFAITARKSAALLGACGLCYLDRRNNSADFSIYIGADDLYIDEVLAPDAGRLLLDYGFNMLKLNRVWAEIYAIDMPKQGLLPALGFAAEGRHREAHRLENGRYTDCLFYGLLRAEWA